MNQKYLVDIGSSTIKVYKKGNDILELIRTQTFDFKKDFIKGGDISNDNKLQLYNFFKEICKAYNLNKANTKLFATGLFREIGNTEKFVSDFYLATGLYFNIISHELEAFYLEKAWLGKCNNANDTLVINIGGKTTELIFYKNGVVNKKELLSIGVGTVLKKYPSINESYSPIPLSKIVEEITCELPTFDNTPSIAIYTGGELNYMKLARYPLQKNRFFIDSKHPYCISIQNYCDFNEKVFSQIHLEQLRDLMPDNPNWMNGARACSALAQAICTKYSIKNIIPSDSNIIDGVIIQEARTVVLCGSFNKHLVLISKLIDNLKSKGMTVLSPKNTTVVGDTNGFILFDGDKMINNCKWTLEDQHIQAIKNCDMVIICNFHNYCGLSTVYEWGRAAGYGKKVVFLENNDISQGFDFPYEIGLL